MFCQLHNPSVIIQTPNSLITVSRLFILEVFYGYVYLLRFVFPLLLGVTLKNLANAYLTDIVTMGLGIL